MLKTLRDIDVRGKNVLVRLDLDLPQTKTGFDTTRLDDSLPTLHLLLKAGALHITIIGHLGRPEGKKNRKFSFAPIEKILRKKLSKEDNLRVTLMENLRFDPGEEKGSVSFARTLCKKQDVYVNDSFAASHREHASIMEIPKLLPTVIGLRFEKELIGLEPVILNKNRPLLIILGGAKLETKLPLIELFKEKADVILVGGKLAVELGKHPVTNRKLIIAQLTSTGKDITMDSILQFKRFIAMARTIVWSGPLGVFEDKKYANGTRSIAQSLNHTLKTYTVIGGGDTEAAATKFHAESHISHISTAGGAMLEYIAKGTLPGIEAIAKSQQVFKV